jgi:hypothetical protein
MLNWFLINFITHTPTPIETYDFTPRLFPVDSQIKFLWPFLNTPWLLHIFDLINLKTENDNAVIYIITSVSVLSLLLGLIGPLYILFVIWFVGELQ